MKKGFLYNRVIWRAATYLGLAAFLFAALGALNAPAYGQVISAPQGSVTHLGLGASGVISADGRWIVYNAGQKYY